MVQASKLLIKGDLKTLIRISLPLMFFLFCEALTGFCDRIFLSYHSIDGVSVSLNAMYLGEIFQFPCIAISTMAQVFVGFYQGRGEFKQIGLCVWQFVWFSLLSFLITLPLSYWSASWYFKGSPIENAAINYFIVLAWGNFLFPLTTALSSFYLGRGKTFFVTSLMLGSYVLHLLLSGILIFGVNGIVPPIGIRGAAFGKCVSLTIVCLVLFRAFLTKKNKEFYRTDLWRFSPLSLWGYIQPGLVRAFGYFSGKVWWAIISYMMIKKSGLHLEVLTIGGSLIALFGFIAPGIYRAILTISSNLIGGENYRELWRLCRSFTIYVIGVAFLLILPLIIFPDCLMYFFDASSKAVFKDTFKTINHSVWLFVFALTIQMSFCAVLVALREFKFQLYSYLFLWPISSVVIYFGMIVGKWPATTLWLIMALESFEIMVFFIIRIRQIKRGKEGALLSLGVIQEK